MADPRSRPGPRGSGGGARRRGGAGRAGGTGQRAGRAPGADPARTAALTVLRAVAEDDAYANLALATTLREHGLSGRDAALTTELVAGTLRRQGTYDAVLAACAGRPVDRVDAPVLAVLRLGAHQLLSTRVPPHAAVATSVDLAREVGGRKVTGFVNAVLRRVGEQDLAGWVRRLAPDPRRDRHGFAAIAHAHPRWVVDALAESLAATGRAAELEDLLVADNAAPAVTLVARPGLVSPDDLLAEAAAAARPGPSAPARPTTESSSDPGSDTGSDTGSATSDDTGSRFSVDADAGAGDGAAGSSRTPWSRVGVRLAGGDPGALPSVRSGRAGVQDEGSQLVALALADAPVEGRDEQWLDLCAGPGGKAALLGSLAARRGARLLAVERQPHRADLVRRATSGVPAGTVDVVVGDGRVPAWPAGSFDRVLVDVPCTGLGALRRRPEARWRRAPDDLDGLVPLQHALLVTAVESVRPGGVVAFVTCSPVLAETVGAVSGLLGERHDVELLDARDVLVVPDADGAIEGTVQLWPHRHGTDAMFLALLRRR